MADKKVSDLPSLNGADVDAADLLYIVDSSAGAAGSKKITVGQYQLAPVSGGTANTVVYLNGSKVESSSSALTFDGTNLGIGTSSPSAKLEVASGKVLLSNTQSYAIKTSAGASCDVVTLTSGNVLQLGGGGATDSIQFWNQGAQRMALDSSGNLGLGVTPSAWSSSFSVIDLKNFGALWAVSPGSVFLTSNAYNNGTNYIYKSTAAASQYQQAAGAHYWYTAPSGTAGNAISFTQAMTLDASGNLGVGVTSISGFRADILSTSTDAAVRARTSNNNEVLRVESAGTATSAIRFINTSVNNTYISADGTALTFLTGGSERARITSDGDLLVGTTSQPSFATSRLVVAYGTADYAFALVNSNATPYGMAIGYTGASPNNTSSAFFYCQDSGPTQRFSVRANGGVYNYSANDVNLSDRREKTNFAPAKSYLDTICAIPVQTFNYIDQNMEEDPGKTLGVVAQDVQAVAPELVMESNWGTKDDPKMRLSVYQTDLQYALMKCIQELKAQNDELRARVAALEAK